MNQRNWATSQIWKSQDKKRLLILACGCLIITDESATVGFPNRFPRGFITMSLASETAAPKSTPISCWILCAGCLVMGFILGYYRAQSWGTIPKPLPGWIGAMRARKATCEDWTTGGSRFLRGHPQAREHLNHGRSLYRQVKSSQYQIISILKVSLIVRSSDEEIRGVAQHLEEIKQKEKNLLDWLRPKPSDDPRARSIGEPPVGDSLKVASEIIKLLVERDDRIVQRLCDELEQCRLRDWSELEREEATQSIEARTKAAPLDPVNAPKVSR